MPNPKDLSFSDALDAVRAAPVPEDHTPSSARVATDAAMSLAPHIQGVLEELATNPALASKVANVARYGTTAAVAGKGLISGNPTMILAAPAAGWTAGKGGYFGAKMLQDAATVGAKAAPFAQTLATLSGAQGALDLAQMAEPTRSDIGVLGVGKTVNVDPNDVRVKAQLEMNRANALKWAADHPSPSVQGLKNAFADMIAALKSHVEGTK